jgi:hypothetical protein
MRPSNRQNNPPPNIVRTGGVPATITRQRRFGGGQEDVPNPVYQRIQMEAEMGNRPWIPALATHVPFSTTLRPGGMPDDGADRAFGSNIYSNLNELGGHVIYDRNRVGSSQHYGVPHQNIEQELTTGTNRRRYQGNRVSTERVNNHTFTPTIFTDVINNIQQRPTSTQNSLTLQHRDIPVVQLFNDGNVRYGTTDRSTIHGEADNNGRFTRVRTMYPDNPRQQIRRIGNTGQHHVHDLAQQILAILDHRVQ